MNFSQWKGIARFSKEMKEDRSNYNPIDAWPTLLDDYCECVEKENKA